MANQFKTGMLLIMMTGLFLLIGYLLGGRGGMFIALIFAAVMNISSYWFSDKVVLKMYRAQPLDRSQAPGLFDTVARLAQQAGLPMPKVYLIPESAPNAFATGRNPEHAVVAVTQGLMNMMNQQELEGVLAHELGHVKNRDILISTIVATLAGAIMWIASIARFSAFFGGRDDDEGGLGIIGVLLVSMLAPIAATVVQMAVSRSREYLADATAAKITGNPKGLASALSKLGGFSRSRAQVDASPATAHMFIVNPLTGKQMMSLFSTHPPIEDRVARLMGSRPQGPGSSHRPGGENSSGQSNGATMNNQSRSFWDNMS